MIWLTTTLLIFIPMNFGAPVGKLIVYKNSIPIAPAVSGLVSEVADIAGHEHIKKGDILFRIQAVTYQSRVDKLSSQLELAKIRQAQASKLLKANAGRVGDVQQYNAEVKSFEAQMQKARFDLENTDVRAPADGYIPSVLLQPGSWLNTGVSVMRLIDESKQLLGVQIDQINLRHVKAEQNAEVIFKLYPGKVFNATVVSIIEATPGIINTYRQCVGSEGDYIGTLSGSAPA